MTDRELERKLADAVARTAPDDLDAILSRCGAQNGSVMEMKASKQDRNIIEGKTKTKWGRWLAAACAALVLVGGGSGVYYHQSYAVASVVSLDVNPSIELKVNRNEKVISCTALNTEAAAVLFSMDGGSDLKGIKLDVAVNAIVGALVREGYLDSISSAILISVEDNDQDRAQRLQAELVASVDSVLQTQAPGTDVLGQVVTMDAGAEPVIYGEGISLGKASLVNKVMEMNGTLATNSTTAFEQLAALSVEELNDLLKMGEKRIPIGKSNAALAVGVWSGTAILSSVTTDVDPELDKGIYEVELKTAGGEFEFEYTVDAFTGEVLSGPKDILDPATGSWHIGVDAPAPAQTPAAPDYPAQSNIISGQDVGQDAALLAALHHAGLTQSQITGLEIERDCDDDRLEYEIGFWCGTTEYEYTIDGWSCDILDHELDHHYSSNYNYNNSNSNNANNYNSSNYQSGSHHSSGHH